MFKVGNSVVESLNIDYGIICNCILVFIDIGSSELCIHSLIKISTNTEGILSFT